MPDAWLPLFPLQLVLLPGTPLPLHIFEDRYKELVGDVLRSKSEFGVVQSAEKGIANTGCTATIERVLKEYPDGRLDIVTLGRRRFEVMLLNSEKSFLRGTVQFFDDEEEEEKTADELCRRAIEAFNEVRAVTDVHVFGEPEMSDPRLSFKLAQLVTDLEFRQMLLGIRSETERIRQVIEYFPIYAAQQKRAFHAKEVAPRNGHGGFPAGVYGDK